MSPDRDLFANFERMRREIDELFGDVLGRAALAPRRRGGFRPPIDVSYAEDPPRAVVMAALPGVRLDELELQIRGRALHIAGQRRPGQAEGRVYQQIEIEHGSFHRVIELGADVVAERISASFEDGMLRIELPLAAPEPAKRAVAIQVGSREHDVPRPPATGSAADARR